MERAVSVKFVGMGPYDSHSYGEIFARYFETLHLYPKIYPCSNHFRRDITDVEFIGRGGFGEVCKGKITGDDGKFMDVAIKKIKFAGQVSRVDSEQAAFCNFSCKSLTIIFRVATIL